MNLTYAFKAVVVISTSYVSTKLIEHFTARNQEITKMKELDIKGELYSKELDIKRELSLKELESTSSMIKK